MYIEQQRKVDSKIIVLRKTNPTFNLKNARDDIQLKCIQCIKELNPVQRTTEISYKTKTFYSETKGPSGYISGMHATLVGDKMEATLDPSDPVVGSGTENTTQKVLMEDLKSMMGARVMIKGHLLNHDLGGLAIASNLFPISNTFNTQVHSKRIETPIKKLLDDNFAVRYKVRARPVKLHEENPNAYQFDWAMTYAPFTASLPDLPDSDYGQWDYSCLVASPPNGWKHGNRTGLPYNTKTNNNLTHVSINDTEYDCNTLRGTPFHLG